MLYLFIGAILAIGSKSQCSSDGDCSITGYEACDTSVTGGACVPCVDDADCAASTIYSLSGFTTCTSNVCTAGSVTCSSDDDCSTTGFEACLQSTGACVPCNTDADCAASATYSLAGFTTCTSNACTVGTVTTTCSSDDDCSITGYEACQTSSGDCVPCNTDADCEASTVYSLAGTTTCTSNVCTVGDVTTTCSSDDDCSITGYEACDTSDGSCVPCNTDADCEASTVYSLAGTTTCTSNVCTVGDVTGSCSSDDDCSITGYEACDTSDGSCVPCNTDADCEASTVYSLSGYTTCTSNVCTGSTTTGCESDDDCSITGYGACDTSDGSCVPCNTDADCAASSYYSNLGYTTCSSNVCTGTSFTACESDDDCPDATPTCYTQGDDDAFCYLGCSSDSDCSGFTGTYACSTDPDTGLSGCFSVDCLDADDCNSGEKCLGNECLAETCTTDGDECGDYTCTSDGSCVICQETSDCTDSDSFGEGYTCVDNACVVVTSDKGAVKQVTIYIAMLIMTITAAYM